MYTKPIALAYIYLYTVLCISMEAKRPTFWDPFDPFEALRHRGNNMLHHRVQQASPEATASKALSKHMFMAFLFY